MPKPKIIAIVGPTASGKSGLAVALARKFGGEVVSADSRQVYRGLNIGTGKIARKEMRGVPHHLLDVASPTRTFTVAQYQKSARTAVAGIIRRGNIPIVVGGTGLYMDALTRGYVLPDIKPNPEFRHELEREATAELFIRLRLADPTRARTIDRHNKRRLVRALEIIHATGGPVTELRTKQDYQVLKIGILLPREELWERIRFRFLDWLKKGLLEEIRKLRRRGLSWKKIESFGLEYAPAAKHLRGLLAKEQMIEQSVREIRKYAKRQMTWWRRDPEIRWVTTPREAERLVRVFLRNS